MVPNGIRYAIAISTLLLTACLNESAYPSKTAKVHNTIVSNRTEQHSAEGLWILSAYIDSIFNDRAIAKHIRLPISWQAMTLTIHNDTAIVRGVHSGASVHIISLKTDSLFAINTNGHFTFGYNPNCDCIEAINGEQTALARNPFVYRRVTDNRLSSILSNDSRKSMVSGFYRLFIDSLISGKYTSLDNGKALTLHPDGSMRGFMNYTSYRIHDYFGTYHPFQGYDAICFRDTAVVLPNNAPPPAAAKQWYAWSFHGHVLILTEFTTEDDEDYQIGTRTFRFRRERSIR